MDVKGMQYAISRARVLAVMLLTGAAWLALDSTSAVAQQEEQEGQDTTAECEIAGTPLSQEAEQMLNEGVESEDPDEADELFEQARMLAGQELGSGEGEAEPPPAAVWVAGRAEMRLGNYATADSLLDRFSETKPGCAQFVDEIRQQGWAQLFNEGVEAFQGGDQEAALEQFENANQIFEDARSLSNAAVLQQNQGNLERAAELFRRTMDVAENEEQRSEALGSLAQILDSQGRTEEAITLFEEFLADNPDAVQARVNYGAALMSEGRRDDAMDVYSEVLAEDDVRPQSLLNVSLGLLQSGAHPEALEALQRVRQSLPYEKAAMDYMFQASLGTGELERAVALGDTLMDWYPYEPARYQSMAQALDRLGQTERVQQVLAVQQELPMEFVQVQMQPQGNGVYVVQGVVGGRQAAGQSVPVSFEFLDGSGDVVAESEVTIEVPPEGQTGSFRATVQTEEEVAGFRYGAAGS